MYCKNIKRKKWKKKHRKENVKKKDVTEEIFSAKERQK